MRPRRGRGRPCRRRCTCSRPTTSSGRSATWPAFGMLSGNQPGWSSIEALDRRGATISPDGIVRHLAEASIASSSAMWRPCQYSRSSIVVRFTPHRSPQPDSSVRNPGKNSTRWRSPAPGSTPKRGTARTSPGCACSRSPLVQSATLGDLLVAEALGELASRAARRARRRRRRAGRAAARGRRAPATSSSVMNGRWFTPATVGLEVEEARVEQQRQDELRDRDLVAEPDGPDRRLTGHRAADRGHRVGEVEHPRVGADAPPCRGRCSRKTGMLRSARMIPPGPTVSPTVWRMP